MKRRLLASDDQQLCIIPGSSLVHVNPQPIKVARHFELGFTAGETHYLMSDGPYVPNTPQQPMEPKVEDDLEARRVLDVCSRDLDNLYHEIEELEMELDLQPHQPND